MYRPDAFAVSGVVPEVESLNHDHEDCDYHDLEHEYHDPVHEEHRMDCEVSRLFSMKLLHEVRMTLRACSNILAHAQVKKHTRMIDARGHVSRLRIHRKISALSCVLLCRRRHTRRNRAAERRRERESPKKASRQMKDSKSGSLSVRK